MQLRAIRYLPTFFQQHYWLFIVGLVQIPGVMTGQILAGVDPLQAIRYQIMIMYMWVTTVILVDVLVLSLVYRQFFTDREQLRYDLLRTP